MFWPLHPVIPPTTSPPVPYLTSPHWRTFSRVSGSLRATRPPHTSAAKDSRMGMALVMPTKLAKIELPSTAANLQRAFSKPNAVALRDTDRDEICACDDRS